MASSFRKALDEAVAYFAEHGYGSAERLSDWMRRLHAVARQDLATPAVLQGRMKAAMDTYFRRAISYTVVQRKHPGVPRFTIKQVEPKLHAELSRRIQASADLIKLNQSQSVEKTLQRFSGWATSIPDGGTRFYSSGDGSLRDVKADISKALKQLSYEERRVAIDQGHKLMASIDAVIAQQNDAIAAIWRDHGHSDRSYDARPNHMARDGKYYLIRGSWAHTDGLVKSGPSGYSDSITQPAEEVFCRCNWIYIYNLRDLPDEMLTMKGKEKLEETRIKAA